MKSIKNNIQIEEEMELKEKEEIDKKKSRKDEYIDVKGKN